MCGIHHVVAGREQIGRKLQFEDQAAIIRHLAGEIISLGRTGEALQAIGIILNSPQTPKLFKNKKEKKMPHVIVKLYPGRTEEQKKQLVEEIAKDIVAIAKCEDKAVSVAIEEIDPSQWAEKVYKPDILEKKDSLYKEPGYNPFE